MRLCAFYYSSIFFSFRDIIDNTHFGKNVCFCSRILVRVFILLYMRATCYIGACPSMSGACVYPFTYSYLFYIYILRVYESLSQNKTSTSMYRVHLCTVYAVSTCPREYFVFLCVIRCRNELSALESGSKEKKGGGEERG